MERTFVNGVDISDPTAAAIAAGLGSFDGMEESAFCAFNFQDASELEHEDAASSSAKALGPRIKNQLRQLLRTSRAFKHTEQTLSVERCKFKSVNDCEEIMATTFEPLRDLVGMERHSTSKDDKVLMKHRDKYAYMIVDSMRIAVTSLLHENDVRDCIMYITDRRIADPMLGALALINFKLPGMQTHVYKTGRIVGYSKGEKLAAAHLQLVLYVKGANLLRKDNAPIAVNVRTSLLFSDSAENAVKHENTLDTEGNLVAFMQDNNDLFDWLPIANGGGYQHALSSRALNIERGSIMSRWATPTGNISLRHGPSRRNVLTLDSTSAESSEFEGKSTEDVVVINQRPLSRGKEPLTIGKCHASLQATYDDKEVHRVQDFVRDAEIAPVEASLETFMAKTTLKGAQHLLETQFSRPVYTDTFMWTSSHQESASIYSVELPGDVISPTSSSLFADTVQRAYCFRADFRFHIIMAGNESFTGTLVITQDCMRRFHEARQDDDLAFMSMPGELLVAHDTNGMQFTVPYDSIHSMISAHDRTSHNALSRISFRVLNVLNHTSLSAPQLAITVQIYAENVEVRHNMWKSLETTFPTSRATEIASIVGQRYGRHPQSHLTTMGATTLNGLLTQKAYIGGTKITSDMVMRLQVAEFAVHPMSSPTHGGVLKLTQLAAISALYNFWKGSLNIHFQINCSSSTRGKILLSITPKGGIPVIGVESMHLGDGAEFDLGTAHVRSFNVPFANTDEWETIGNSGLMSAFEGTWDCPVARIVVVHPITSIGEITPSVTVRVFLTPGKDFMLRGRRHLGLRSMLKPFSFGMGQGAGALLEGLDYALMSTVNIDARQVSVIIAIPCAPWYSKAASDYTLMQNPLHWASRLFTFWRGSLAYRIVIKPANYGDSSESAISMWHNSNASMDICSVGVYEGKKISKEGFPTKKISLKQTFSCEIEAEDDQRFAWRLCKILDTTHGDTKGETSVSKTTYTGHPPLSSHTGMVFVKFPVGTVEAQVKIYSKPGPDFEFRHLGGVPSLRLPKMPPYKRPFQLNSSKVEYVDHSEGTSNLRDSLGALTVGKSRGFSSVIKATLARTQLSSPEVFVDSKSDAFEVGPCPKINEPTKSLMERARDLVTSIIGRARTYIMDSLCNVMANTVKHAAAGLFGAFFSKVEDIFVKFLSGVVNAYVSLLTDPQSLCILALTISLLVAYSTLKLAASVMPTSLGVFKSLMAVAISSMCALYWPTGVVTLISSIDLIYDQVVECCHTIHNLFFPSSTLSKTDGAPSSTPSAAGLNDNLTIGKSHGFGANSLEIVGLMAWIKLVLTLCNVLSGDRNVNLAGMEKSCRTISGISQGIRHLRDFKDYIFRNVVTKLSPSSTYVSLSQTLGFDIREWLLDVERLTLQENRYSELSCPDKLRDIRLCYDKGVQAMGALSKIENAHLARVCERSYKLAKDLLDETHRVKGVAELRVDPFHVSLYGAPGVGKSFIMGKLLNDLLDFMGEPTSDRTYSKTPNEEYWSGYYGQTAIKCDDLGQDLSKGYSPTYNQIIQMKTNNPFIVPMADLANKGRTFSSKYIFSTTNVAGCGTKHGLAEPEAFLRRRDLLVHVTSEGDFEPGFVDHLRFTILNSREPTERNLTYPENMTYADFLCVCVTEATRYFKMQQRVLETLSGGKSTHRTHKPSNPILELVRAFSPELAEEFLERAQTRDCGYVESLPELNQGKAHGLDYEEFKYDLDGNKLPQRYVRMLGTHRDEFAKCTKILLSDDDLQAFGLLLGHLKDVAFSQNVEKPAALFPVENFSKFFHFVFQDKMHLITEQQILQGFDAISRSQIMRLVQEARPLEVGHSNFAFPNEYDAQTYEQMVHTERFAFLMCVAVRRARASKVTGIRDSMEEWFSYARGVCSELLAALPGFVKVALVVATSCGALYLSFLGLKHIGLGIASIMQWRSESEEGCHIDDRAQEISLPLMLARGAKGRVKIHSDDEVSERTNKAVSRSRLTMGVARGGLSCESTRDSVTQRQGALTNLAIGWGVSAINIGAGFLLAPLHIFSHAEEDDTFEFRWMGEGYLFPFSAASVSQVGQWDACIIDTKLAVPSRRMIFSLFMDETELESYTDLKCTFLGGQSNNSHAYVTSDLVAFREKAFQYEVRDTLIISVLGWRVQLPTVEGQCGSVLCSDQEKVNGKIFALLVAGATERDSGKDVATFVPITKQALVEAFKAFSTLNVGKSQMDICGVPIDQGLRDTLRLDEYFEDAQQVQAKGERCGIYKPLAQIGQMQVVGRLRDGVMLRSPTKTSIAPSIIQAHLPREPQTEPAILSPHDPRLGDKSFDPLIDGIKKYSHQAAPFRTSSEQMILQTFTEEMVDWESHMVRQNFKATDMPLDVVINGIDGCEYYEGINMSSSEGFPLILGRPPGESGKAYLFSSIGDSDKREISSDNLRRHYEAYGAALEKESVPPLLCIECPKDERRPLSKIYETPKTRLFSNLPVEFNMHARRLFLDFNVFVMSNRHKHGIMVGINPHSREWSDMAISLASFAPRGFNGDFANFDGMFHPGAFSMVSKLANRFYGDFLAHQRNALTASLSTRLSIVKGAVVSVGCGGPSGFPMTVIFNSFINLFYLMAAWSDLALENNRADISHPRFFRKYVRAFVYGDDNIVSIKEEVIDWYNLCTVSDYLLTTFRVTMTDGAKRSAHEAKPCEPILSFDFLKRGFRAEPTIPSLFHAPLSRRSIEEQLYWIRTGGDEGALLENNVENALYEAYHHGRSYFDQVRESIRSAYKKIGLDPVLPTFHMQHHRWMHQDLGEISSNSCPSRVGLIKAAISNSVSGAHGRDGPLKILELDFDHSKDSLGGLLVSGRPQELVRGFWILSREQSKHNELYRESRFSLVLDNTLSLSQSRYGARHGICSLINPDFTYIQDSAPILLASWPALSCSIDKHGGLLAMYTGLCLLHFCKIISVHALCSTARRHDEHNNKRVLQAYFRWLESPGAQTVIGLVVESRTKDKKVEQSTCARTLRFEHNKLQGDALFLPIEFGTPPVANTNNSCDSADWSTDDPVEID